MEKGLSGGAEAARSLREEIQKRFEYIDPATTKPFKIMVRIYLNLDGLFQALDRAGLVQDAETIRHFSRGFTQFQSLFDLVDVGFDHSYVRLKMEGDLACAPDTFSVTNMVYHWKRFWNCVSTVCNANKCS